MKYFLLATTTLLLFVGCATKQLAKQAVAQAESIHFTKEELFDESRQRQIPIAYFVNPENATNTGQKVVIFSHGYGKNKGGDYLEYGYLTQSLADAGYFVVSIQHELPTDDLLAMDGKFMETRMPNWRRGMENIHLVLRLLKSKFPDLDYEHVTVIGHSNGGDMSVLFAHEYPSLIQKVISLDNRRMPLPRTAQPKVYTLRSNDFPADEGVLPSADERWKYGISVQFTDINHGSMGDNATLEERKIILEYIHQYIED